MTRVCVELDLLKEHLIRIRLGVEGVTYFQSIFYENMPQYCVDCKKIGGDQNPSMSVIAAGELPHSNVAQPVSADKIDTTEHAIRLEQVSSLLEYQAIAQNQAIVATQTVAATETLVIDLPIIDPPPKLQETAVAQQASANKRVIDDIAAATEHTALSLLIEHETTAASQALVATQTPATIEAQSVGRDAVDLQPLLKPLL
ncbi:OLC1v1007367C1 [Oldenlandia corymbosa var. corymbosa]|uniref:OLC1v1007367C1 n=1 Tax=Oldenlandia corymbosa var. corymbosa TaxID=529605 RepID=A0AAV1DJ10_OLDCO|nr:OLC1v1007367C1 [Oldenlandia corymbosa var. corymbosa]